MIQYLFDNVFQNERAGIKEGVKERVLGYSKESSRQNQGIIGLRVLRKSKKTERFLSLRVKAVKRLDYSS
jgi:hypothetical protein